MLTKEEVKVLRGIVEREEGIQGLREQYEEYKKLDTPRGKDKMEDAHVLDDYNEFMDNAEKILFPEEKEESVLKVAALEETDKEEIIIPKPSDALEKFKNRFNKFF
jgi:hypothetical protein